MLTRYYERARCQWKNRGRRDLNSQIAKHCDDLSWFRKSSQQSEEIHKPDEFFLSLFSLRSRPAALLRSVRGFHPPHPVYPSIGLVARHWKFIFYYVNSEAIALQCYFHLKVVLNCSLVLAFEKFSAKMFLTECKHTMYHSVTIFPYQEAAISYLQEKILQWKKWSMKIPILNKETRDV